MAVMESIAEHKLEPELLGQTPRRLRLPWRTSLLLLAAALLLGFFVLGSGRALWEGAKMLWLECAGQTISGEIIAIRISPRTVIGQLPPQTAICYTVDLPNTYGLRSRRGWVALGAPIPATGLESGAAKLQPASRFRLGQPFPLRCASFFGIVICRPWGPSPGSRSTALPLAGGLVLAVSLRLLRRLGRWAGGRLYLLRQGTATVGTITHKRSETEDMARYYLRYGYAAGSALGQDREEQVSADHWREFQVGQPVTVLYDPHDPSHAGLYALIVR